MKKSILLAILMATLGACASHVTHLRYDLSTGTSVLLSGNDTINKDYVKKGNLVAVEFVGVPPSKNVRVESSQADVDADQAITSPFSADMLKTEPVVEDDKKEELNQEIQSNEAKKIQLLTQPELFMNADGTTPMSRDQIETELKVLDELQAKKKDSMEALILHQEVKTVLNTIKTSISTLNADSLKIELLSLHKNTVSDYKGKLDSIKPLNVPSLYNDILGTISEIEILLFKTRQLKFERNFNFTPKKETVEVELFISQVGVENSEIKHPYSFNTLNRMKFFGSVGLHMNVVDGKYANDYANVDSIITRADGANAIPSFGTYINAVWRRNDFLAGFGAGTGIPLLSPDGSYTPNLVAFGTFIFQSDLGKMGFNIGVGFQQVKVLATGYEVGDRLSDVTSEVPMKSQMKPSLMFGVNYSFRRKDN